MRQILTRPMIDAFAFGHDEYSDGMGRTYAEVDHDESYDVGRTVAEMPPAWRTLLRAAPDLLAALRKALEWVEHVEAVAWDSIPEDMRGDNGAAWAIRSALARATGGAR